MWNGSSSRTFYFPRGCSRCLADTETVPLERQWQWVERSGNIQTTTTLTLHVPVCPACQQFVESAESWTAWGGFGVAVVGAVFTIGALLTVDRPRGDSFPVLFLAGVAWALFGVVLYFWLYGVLGLWFVRPVDKGEYLRFSSGEYQEKFDRANPAASRRVEGYFTQYFLYLVYLVAAVYVPFFGIFFWLATFRDHRRLVMKWVVLGLSLAYTGFLFWHLSEGLGWWAPWLPK
jgi:hypothetical protein